MKTSKSHGLKEGMSVNQFPVLLGRRFAMGSNPLGGRIIVFPNSWYIERFEGIMAEWQNGKGKSRYLWNDLRRGTLAEVVPSQFRAEAKKYDDGIIRSYRLMDEICTCAFDTTEYAGYNPLLKKVFEEGYYED